MFQTMLQNVLKNQKYLHDQNVSHNGSKNNQNINHKYSFQMARKSRDQKGFTLMFSKLKKNHKCGIF